MDRDIVYPIEHIYERHRFQYSRHSSYFILDVNNQDFLELICSIFSGMNNSTSSCGTCFK